MLNGRPDVSAERAFLPDDAEARARARASRCVTYESSPPSATSRCSPSRVAYELELAGLVDCLELAGHPALAASGRATRGRTR